ncbi:MAG TPA: glycosyltransferase family 4 protein [Chitinophagales bacterium]|nr:glycosyltransferase family 4 protein [Chitinophagales bacterium]
MGNTREILFFYNHLSSFVKKDIDILSEKFAVKQHDFLPRSKFYTPLSFLSQLFFLLRNMGGAHLLVVQFAGYHSFLPALFGWLFRTPCVIIVGGTDAHYFPGIGYGNWQKPVLKTFTKLSFTLCSHIAPKHKTLMQFEYQYAANEPTKQGIYARIPGLQTPYTQITNGYDEVKWHCVATKKSNTFITVSGAWEYHFQQQLKGIDLILEVAPQFPHCEFIILGVDNDSRIKATSPNVKVLPAVKNEELIKVFSSCEYYLQLSMAEGFPNALCEAMLCECIPIGSAVFSIPEIIGDSGFVLQQCNATLLSALLKQALAADKQSLRAKARQRIANNYTLAKRKASLLQLCAGLMGS